jgi:uncharacterized protein
LQRDTIWINDSAFRYSETQETRYLDRLLQAYPIHPEVFDRLYEDWITIEGFQRTRGMLTLMAKVIYRLWKDDNKDLMIVLGSLPFYDGNTRNELTYYFRLAGIRWSRRTSTVNAPRPPS